MKGELNLIEIAREVLAIHEEFPYHLKDMENHYIGDFEMETFTQIWGNTSGGFCSMGGCAMTTQRTYVFISQRADEKCQVYFGGRYAYSVPYSEAFMNDVKNHCVEGCGHQSKYVKKD